MKEEVVEIIEYYDGKGNIYKKIANGVDLKIPNDLLPTIAMQRFYITKQEYEENYKKWIK